eukprot:6203784-Pleurochrysis_carterae.AAC.3
MDLDSWTSAMMPRGRGPQPCRSPCVVWWSPAYLALPAACRPRRPPDARLETTMRSAMRGGGGAAPER